MKLIVNELDTVTVEFTRDEIEAISAMAAYVADEFMRGAVDREALDGWRMTLDDASNLDHALHEIATVAYLNDPELRQASRERAIARATGVAP